MMKLLNKIKKFFEPKKDLSSRPSKIENQSEIEKFLSVGSGWKNDCWWEKEKIVWIFRQSDQKMLAHLKISRPATQEEIHREKDRKMDCEISMREPKTLDKVWEEAIEEIDVYGKLLNEGVEPRRKI